MPEPVPLVGTPCWLQMMSFTPWKLILQPPTTVADASRFADVPTGELLPSVRNVPPTYRGIVPPALVDGSAMSGEPPPERQSEPAVYTGIVRSAELPMLLPRAAVGRHAVGRRARHEEAPAVDGRRGRPRSRCSARTRVPRARVSPTRSARCPTRSTVHSSAPDFVAEYAPRPAVDREGRARERRPDRLRAARVLLAEHGERRVDARLGGVERAHRVAIAPARELVGDHQRRDRHGRDRERRHDDERQRERDAALVAEGVPDAGWGAGVTFAHWPQ